MNVICNYRPRDLISWFDLSDSEKEEFNWIPNATEAGESFFKYRGVVYYLGDFMQCEIPELKAKGFRGFAADSYFSGVAFKFCNDSESVIVARCFS